MLSRIMPFFGLAFFIIAIAVVHHEMKEFHYSDIVNAVKQTPVDLIAIGLALTFFNYLTLTVYDFLALKYIGKSIPPYRVMLASFAGFAVSNNVGHALVSGPSVRYRFYKAWGLSGVEMIKLTIFLSVMYILGAATLTVGTYFLFPQPQFESSALYFVIHTVIYTATAILIVYWLAICLFRKSFTILNVSISLPTARMTLAQTVIAGIDLVLASLTLYMFLNHNAEISFTTFLVVFLVAQASGFYSQVPGGIGVFEGVFVYLISNMIPSHIVLASLILYRIVYYFIPLGIAGIGIIAYEFYERRKAIAQIFPK